MEIFFQAVFLCQKTKSKGLEEAANPDTEKELQARDTGIVNDGMDAVDIEGNEDNNTLEYVSDTPTCSHGSEDSSQRHKGTAEEGLNPDHIGNSGVHRLLSARYDALGPLSFKEQQVKYIRIEFTH